MNRLLAALALVLVPALLLARPADTPDKTKATPEAKAKPTAWTPELAMRVKAIGPVVPSPDGKQVAYVVGEAVMEGEKSETVSQIYLANADGSDAFQLTRGEKSSSAPQWSPDGAWIAFTSARSDKNNVWLIRVRGGEAERLTDAKGGVGGFAWAPDGKSIAFTAVDPQTPEEEKAAKEKNDARVVDDKLKMSRLHIIPIAKGEDGKREARLLTKGNFSISSGFLGSGFDWAPDGKAIVFSHTPTAKVDDWTKADLSVVDVVAGEVKPLAKTGAAETSPHYSPDGKWIAFVKTDDPPTWATNATVQVVSAEGGKPRELAETFDRRPQIVGWSADGSKIYYTEAHHTASRLCALPVDGGKPEVISKAEGTIGPVALNSKRTAVGFSLQTSAKPPEAHVSPLDNFAPAAVSTVNKDVPKLPLGRTEAIRWKSADGMEIEGLLTWPANHEEGKRYPLLLIIHGGPTGVFSETFIASPSLYPIATFAAKGYAVLRCNPRGSGGYGQKFRYANYKDWGGGDYKDLMAGVDHVIGMGLADKDRLGVMGWSYGGYMTSWIITQTKRFKAASVGAGVTNLMSFTGTADIPSFLPDYFGGEPWDDLETYRKHSAMFNVKGVTTPTLIQHGEKDERVPISQGYELYNALKRQGCPVQMVVYPRTPHGPQEPKLLLDVMKRNVAWFDKHLREEGSGAGTATGGGGKSGQ
jgi:dipeptidyl aminopeptidase/acylaminoacyl peptidase